MKRDPLPAKVLATRLIPNVSADMAKQLNLKPEHKSLALLTADCDDVTYTALDEATKKADCEVVYAKSFYAGAANANTKLAGEIIGILAAPNPAEAKAGLEAAVDNFGGALLTGSQSACKAACDAFAYAVEAVADRPIE